MRKSRLIRFILVVCFVVVGVVVARHIERNRLNQRLVHDVLSRRQADVAVALRLGADPNTELKRRRSFPAEANAMDVHHTIQRSLAKDDDVSGVPLLFVAIDRGETEAALALIRGGANPNTRCSPEMGWDVADAVHLAIFQHNMPVLACLLTHGASPNILSNGFDIYLQGGLFAQPHARYEMWSGSASPCHDDSDDAVHVLLEHGMDPNGTDSSGGSMLRYAFTSNALSAIHALLDRGANANGVKPREMPPVAQLIFQQGQVNLNDPGSLFPMPEAIVVPYVKKYIDLGGDVSAVGADGTTALHYATYAAVAELLIAHGAKVDARDKYSRTPLMDAFGYDPNRITLVKTLLTHGADVNARATDGTTPIIVACRDGACSLDLVKLLVTHGANVNAQDHYGDTALNLSLVPDQTTFTPVDTDVSRYLRSVGAKLGPAQPGWYGGE